ncbi:coiled-coil domain-containing protein 172-like isoform X2 [Acanthaster planci]|uniref:Coiled-coil domain-containing protein 172 n=1 Tax=Acanthaster planci TaxID=133434 RepID=A0A8B7YWJ4_ACAPL|nr:coiled-coil domain-containing protein 172-like isoform X2 [Acanthaster planci]
MSLNDLFVQILQSEQKAKERKALLSEVRNEITQVKQQIKEVQEECLSTQGQLVVKIQHQTEAELSVVWLRHKEGILKDQLARALKERDSNAQELKSLEAVQTKEQEDFSREIANFNQAYGLCGDGKEQRESEARQQLQELKNEEEKLLTEVSEYRNTKAALRKLNEEKKKLESEVHHLQDTLQGLHEQLDQKQSITKKLERVKSEVATLPQNDPEFLRLRSKLEACHEEGLEAICQALQQEVDRLQRQRWQQQLQLQRLSSQAGGSGAGTAAGASSEQQNPSPGKRKAQKRQVQPSSLSSSNQTDSVNTWSSFRVTCPMQPTPSPQDANPPAAPPQTQARTADGHHPAGPSATSQPSTAPCIKKEPSFHPGGVSKPNWAKLTRGAKKQSASKSQKPDSNNTIKRFLFLQTGQSDRAPSTEAQSIQPSTQGSTSSVMAADDGKDGRGGFCTTTGTNPARLSQVPGTAKKVHFK